MDTALGVPVQRLAEEGSKHVNVPICREQLAVAPAHRLAILKPVQSKSTAGTVLGAHVQQLAEAELKLVHAPIQRLLMAEQLAVVPALRRAILKPVQSMAFAVLPTRLIRILQRALATILYAKQELPIPLQWRFQR